MLVNSSVVEFGHLIDKFCGSSVLSESVDDVGDDDERDKHSVNHERKMTAEMERK